MPLNSKSSNVHAMTIDVEDYFQVSAFENVIAKPEWNKLPLRVEINTHRLLDLFSEHDIKATFFTLGWVARRCTGLINRIVKEGHELACHGYAHGRATEQTPDEFRADVARSKNLLEDISGCAVLGYRAPSFSVNDSNTWVFDELKALGFSYSSSTYPVKHDLYGVPHWPRFTYKLDNGLIEVPMTTLKIANKTIPIAGGGYFRLYPYRFSHFLLQRFQSTEQRSGMFYMHPWEIDPQQPRLRGIPAKSAFRHYLNLSRQLERLTRLIEDFCWGRMDEVFVRPMQESTGTEDGERRLAS